MIDVKAIIFDCFGVLVRSSLEPFYEEYFADDHEKIAQAKELDSLSSKGILSYDDFVVALAGLAGMSAEKAKRYLENNPVNQELIDYISQKLYGKYKIGFLSNASENWLDELFTADQLKLFDDFVLSFEHNIAKPEEAIYRLAASRLQVELAECVFVDDVLSYCDAAKNIGMNTVQYISFEQFRAEFENIFVPSHN